MILLFYHIAIFFSPKLFCHNDMVITLAQGNKMARIQMKVLIRIDVEYIVLGSMYLSIQKKFENAITAL